MSLEELKDTIKEAKAIFDELIKINIINRHQYLAMRSRLAVLIVLHKSELDGMGINIDRWIADLEIDNGQFEALKTQFKKH